MPLPSHVTSRAARRRNLCFALVWLLLFSLCGVFSVQQLFYAKPFHSNLLELLPRDERNPVLHQLGLLLASRFQDRLLVLVKADDRAQAFAQAQDLQQRLLASGQLQRDATSDYLQQELIALYRPYSQQLLAPQTRAWLQQLSPAQLAAQTYQELFNPVANPRPYPFAEDPFNLGGRWLTSLAPALNVGEYQGMPLVEADGGRWLLVMARLNSNPFDPAIQQDVSQSMAGFRAAWPQAEILTSGMIFHAAAGTEQATAEISTVGLGSSIGIIAMVLWVFRSPVPLLAVGLTMTSAYLLALTLSLLVFGRIHIITLAFGSTLLGVAGDYVLHFLMGSQRPGGGLAARHHLRYAMAIGAITGMGAYMLQFVTPFPGLQQMAVFCASGIFAAWMTVLALGPYYAAPKPAAGGLAAPVRAAQGFYGLALRVYRPLWRRPAATAVMLLAAALLALVAVVRGGVNDGVVNLNTSPRSLLMAEQQVQQILQQPSISRFFFVEANSSEQLLQRFEALNARLNSAQQPQWRWQSLGQYVPAQAQQEADRLLVAQKLYGDTGALSLLCASLGMSEPCVAPALSAQSLQPDDLNQTSLGQLVPPVVEQGDYWYSLVTIAADAPDSRLAELAAGVPGVQLLNQTDDLSSLLGRYRANVSWVLLVTLVLLTLGLVARYKTSAWRMLLPLLLSLLIALGVGALGVSALSMGTAGGITLFHVMALLLVIGIGLDTAVFYTEGGFNAETWLASSLACGTSILAFGLLSLSAVPVLHQFGVIILVGILCCWLLTPLFYRPSAEAPGDKVLSQGNL